MAIKKPAEMNFSNKNIIMIISGLPGTGKSTLAQSAPGVLTIDTDEGLCRVKAEHRKDASQCATYEEILQDIEYAKGRYETIAIDTGGELINMMKDWAMRTDPKASKPSGGISLQGFGTVKSEFIRFSSELRKNFNVVYLFHEQKTQNGDDLYYDLVCEGAAKTIVYQPADLAAHLFIQNGKRVLGFTPTENYTAKGAYGIHGLIVVPELKDGDENNFLSKVFKQIRENLAKETALLSPEKERYEMAKETCATMVSLVSCPEDVQPCLDALKGVDHALTSEKEGLKMLQKRMKELCISYDKKTNTYFFTEDAAK